jgi:hypothetical protein
MKCTLTYLLRYEMLHATTKTIRSELIATLSERFPLTPPLGERNEHPCSATPEGLFYRFIKEDLTQREERAANTAHILGALLAQPNAKELAARLDPNYRPHRRLVSEDILEEVRREVSSALEERHGFPLAPQVKIALDDQLDHHYRGVMSPYIIALQERKAAANAKKGTSLPNGFLSGRQGIVNSMALLDYIVNDSPGLSLKQQLQAIGEGAFSVEFFTAHHFAGALTTQFQNSPAVAMQRYFLEHPSHRVRRHAAHLGQEHFPQTNGLWTEQGSPERSPGDGWEFHMQGSRWVNKGLARSAIGQVIDSMIGNPTGRPLPSSDYITRVENLIENVTETDFNAYRVRFNRTFGTVVPLVFDGSLPNALIDYLHHLPRVDIREHFHRLRPYHFRRINTWTDHSGDPKLELAREAIGEAFTTLERTLGPAGFDIQRVPELFQSQWLSESLYFCRFNPAAVIAGAYGFPYVAGIIDFLKHHPSPSIAELYRDLHPRHFARVTNGLWSVKDFGNGPTPEGWRYEESLQRFVNVAEARKMTAELLDRITGDESQGQITMAEIPAKVTLKHFTDTCLPYNSRARGMLAAVYGDSPRLALLDFILSADFVDYVAKRPHAAEQLPDTVALSQFRDTAERILLLPQRERFSSGT